MAIGVHTEPIHFETTTASLSLGQHRYENRAVVVTSRTSALVFTAVERDDADFFNSRYPSQPVQIKAPSASGGRRTSPIARCPVSVRRTSPSKSSLVADDTRQFSLSTASAPAILVSSHSTLLLATMSQNLPTSAHATSRRPANSLPTLRTQMKQDLQRQQCLEEEQRSEQRDALLCMRSASHDYDIARKIYNPTDASYRRLCGLEKGARAMSH